MTTNQTIDGVPLKMLQDLVNGTRSEHKEALIGMREFLRALLDAHPCPVQLDGCDGSCATAAQPQGEPVAVRLPARDESLGTAENDMYANGWRHGWNAYEHAVRQLGPLYAEQPAPVAVVMPERRTFDPLDFVEKRASADGWNACLDELKRLNPYL
ncbi:hypothetical protein [Pseudomonas sp. CHM02]|uniref:hypothetical protein n=1 Tax=Pseudomonas sp. CHM02 TaxID=1463662 RepID=UPI00046FF77C|nr:hypothetical protein [Pseudomonas sp. CHM02]